LATPPQDTVFGTNIRMPLNTMLIPCVATPIIATSTKYANFIAGEHPDAIGNNAWNPTPSLATPIVSTPPKDVIFSIGEPRDTFKHQIGKPTPFVALPPQDAIFDTNEPRKAIGHDVANRRRAPQRQNTPYLRQVSRGMTLDTKLENRRRTPT
jgi:hypothetical protein